MKTGGIVRQRRGGEKNAGGLTLTPGRYDVYAQWAASSNRASNAPYTIHHRDGATTVRVSQKVNGGSWQALGTYTLDTDSRIALSDDADGYVIADAVRLVPVSTADPGPPAAQLYYLHTDHLDTPRLVTDAQNTVVWRNDPLAEPFGLAPPDEDPDGDGKTFTFNLRFPAMVCRQFEQL